MTLAIVIGLGEVGKPIYDLLCDAYGSNAVKGRDIKEPRWKGSYKFMHICIPQTTKFLKILADYAEKYDPEYIIIHSTLHPGTMWKISEWFNIIIDEHQPQIYYSPVRGNTRDGMEWGLTTYTKYVSGAFNYSTDDVIDHLKGAGMPAKQARSTSSLEYAKLFNLAYYAVCIGLFQEIERIVEAKNLNYEEIKEFIFSTEKEAAKGGKNVPRPHYYGGYIGGHCVIPALEKITALHNIPLFKAVIESNIRRERELLLNP